jgi:hypothetical protein
VTGQLYPEERYDPPQQNGLGLAAFVVSLIGLFSAGILSPVGAVMGAIALRRDPKGFAIAGLVIGLFGTLWICLVAAFFIGILGVGITAGVMSLVYAQIEDGITGLNEGADIIVKWQASHDGVLPSSEQGTVALQDAGFLGSYRWIDGDDFVIELVVDEGDGDPWTFVGEFDSGGNRESLKWDSKSGTSHGKWDF